MLSPEKGVLAFKLNNYMHIYGWKVKCYRDKNESLLVRVCKHNLPCRWYCSSDAEMGHWGSSCRCHMHILHLPGNQNHYVAKALETKPIACCTWMAVITTTHNTQCHDSWVIITNMYRVWQIMFALVQRRFIYLYFATSPYYCYHMHIEVHSSHGIVATRKGNQ